MKVSNRCCSVTVALSWCGFVSACTCFIWQFATWFSWMTFAFFQDHSIPRYRNFIFFKYTMISSSLVKKCKINSFRPLFQRALRRFKYNGIIRCAGVCADSMSVMSNRTSVGAVCLPFIAGTKHDAVVWRLWFVWFVKCDDDDDDDEESNESIC